MGGEHEHDAAAGVPLESGPNQNGQQPETRSENPAAYLLYLAEAQRRQTTGDMLARLLAENNTYYYRHGDSSGTQG